MYSNFSISVLNPIFRTFKFSNIPCFKLVATFPNLEKKNLQNFHKFTLEFHFQNLSPRPNKFLPPITKISIIFKPKKEKRKKEKLSHAIILASRVRAATNRFLGIKTRYKAR